MGKKKKTTRRLAGYRRPIRRNAIWPTVSPQRDEIIEETDAFLSGEYLGTIHTDRDFALALIEAGLAKKADGSNYEAQTVLRWLNDRRAERGQG